MKIVLQHTSGAFGSVQDIPEDQWHDGPQVFHNVSTARKAKQEAVAEMRRICGPNAWDRHFRLINAGVLPIKLTQTNECYGSYHEHRRAKDCHRSITVEWFWQPGEPEPRLPPHPWGWMNTCPACEQFDIELDNKWRAEHAREQGWAL